MANAITDFSQFAGLRIAAENKDPAVLREVAGQFEALFIQQLLKNMREASLGDPIIGNSDQHDMYQEMMDQQMAVEMASGKGIGLADMLVRQIGGNEAPAAGAQHGSKSLWTDAKAFAEDVWPHAKRIARKLNVAAEGILAQVALETGWGTHVPEDGNGNSSMNLFGIKAGGDWSGGSVARTTIEFEAGLPRMEIARFRAYADIAATFDDYANMLGNNPRYAGVIGTGDDVDGFADALQTSGYATDPAYADKIRSVVGSKTMRTFLGDL